MPELKDSFSEFRDMNKEDLIKSHTLRTHSKKVVDIVEKVINDIDKKDSKLVEMLQKLGRNHCIYGATNDFLYVRLSKEVVFYE
jgi:hypothetical protein